MNAEDQALPVTTFQLWLLDYPSGRARRLTTDANYYRHVSLTRDAKVLLTTQSTDVSSLWLMPHGDPDRAAQVSSSQGRGTGGIAWTNDGMILCGSDESGNQDIWELEPIGGNVRQLTLDASVEAEPVASPDNQTVIFTSYRIGQPHIYRMDRSGDNQRQLTFGSYEDWPQISPDGLWIIYHSEESRVDRIYKIPIEGGEPIRLMDKPAKHPVISPDGQLIACYSKDQAAPDNPWKLTILSMTSREILKSFAIPPAVSQEWQGMRWAPDGRSVTYIVSDGFHSDLWSQPLAGAPPRKLTDFQDRMTAIAWSPDGSLACVRAVTITDVVLIGNPVGEE